MGACTIRLPLLHEADNHLYARAADSEAGRQRASTLRCHLVGCKWALRTGGDVGEPAVGERAPVQVEQAMGRQEPPVLRWRTPRRQWGTPRSCAGRAGAGAARAAARAACPLVVNAPPPRSCAGAGAGAA